MSIQPPYRPHLISLFKRHYRKMQRTFNAMGPGSAFSLRIKRDQETDSFVTSHSTPDEAATITFVTVMARFMTPGDPLYWANVWGTLRRDFAEELSYRRISLVDKVLQGWRRGIIPMRVGTHIEESGEEITREVTAEEVCLDLINGHKWVALKKAINGHPELALEQMLLIMFYAHLSRGYRVAEYLFDRIAALSGTDKFQRLYPDYSLEPAQCIYCLTTSGTFNSHEHPVPESLGNYDLYLPRGCVCDSCNHRILSDLDKAVADAGPIGALRVHAVLYGKTGKLSSANLPDATVIRTSPHDVAMLSKKGEDIVREHTGSEADSPEYSLNVGGIPDRRLLARGIFKIVLGEIALNLGRSEALLSKYDKARRFILYNEDFQGEVVVYADNTGPIQMRVNIEPYPYLPNSSLYAVTIFGLSFLLSLEEGPLNEANREHENFIFAFNLFGT